MTLEASSQDHTAEALDVRKVMPSKRAISALGSVTNGFLFSTTPIISRILQELYPKVWLICRIHRRQIRMSFRVSHRSGYGVRSSES